jgi:hypothetical protein
MGEATLTIPVLHELTIGLATLTIGLAKVVIPVAQPDDTTVVPQLLNQHVQLAMRIRRQASFVFIFLLYISWTRFIVPPLAVFSILVTDNTW